MREVGPLAAGRYRDRRLEVPALMLTGDADPVVGPALLHGLERHAGAGARNEVVECAGHFLPEERPDAVVAALPPAPSAPGVTVSAGGGRACRGS
jgi:pimeloyl-ACP methyl ester carboxylesterase